MVNCFTDLNQIDMVVGDSFSGTLQLRDVKDSVVSPYAIPVDAIVDVHFPAFDQGAPVVLSTANLGEITIDDAALSTISYSGSVTKALLLNPGNSQRIDVVVTDTSGNKRTFTTDEIVFIENRANP